MGWSQSVFMFMARVKTWVKNAVKNIAMQEDHVLVLSTLGEIM
jgi:hypothetical protein